MVAVEEEDEDEEVKDDDDAATGAGCFGTGGNSSLLIVSVSNIFVKSLRHVVLKFKIWATHLIPAFMNSRHARACF